MADQVIQEPAYNGAPPSGSSQPTSSGRRKASGQSPRIDTHLSEELPIAPEPPKAPRAPPMSYRNPYDGEQQYTERGPPSSKSFAARAGILPEQFSPQANEFTIREPSQDLVNGSERRRRSEPKIYPKSPISNSQAESPRLNQPQAYNSQPAQRSSQGYTHETQAIQKPDRSPSSATQIMSKSSQPQTQNAQKSPRELPQNVVTAEKAVLHQRPVSDVVQPVANQNDIHGPTSPRTNTNSMPTRSTSKRYSTNQPLQAVEKSPLQKLELKLNDISKEEKRARVELAEQKLREKEAALGRRTSQASNAPERQSSTNKRSTSGTIENRRTSPSRVNSTKRSSTRDSSDLRIDTAPGQAHSGGIVVPRSSKSISASNASVQPAMKRGSGEGVRFNNQVYDMESNTPRRSVSGNTPTSALAKNRGSLENGSSLKKHGARESENDIALPQDVSNPNTHRRAIASTETTAKAEPSIENHHHHFSDYFHRKPKEANKMVAPAGNFFEWKNGQTALLTLADIKSSSQTDHSPSEDEYQAWWEESQSADKRKRKKPTTDVDQMDGYFDEQSAPSAFEPPLYLKCGPLLRYCGLRVENPPRQGHPKGEIWRGSVMIVTEDEQSTYDTPPTLRLFHQPMQLLPPPPVQFDEDAGEGLESEYVDPIGGLPKLTRTGGTVYVKPVEDLDIGKDVSRLENDDGLYEETRTANVPTSYGKADELLGRSPHPTRLSHSHGALRQTGRYREVKGVRLHAERGVTFWRFKLEVELGEHQQRIAYRINRGASVGFWVPARGRSMNIMFHSCNGFSMSVDSNLFSGPDPLWRDVLNAHQIKPFHVMLGGGDQIYNDAVMRQTTLFQDWLEIKNPHHKHQAPFTTEMMDELEEFYLDRYCMWFSQGLFGMANSQIPMINVWDDHDIIDGFGSYPHHFMNTPVFSGLGNIAFKYYMLFQHQSVVEELTSDEPSWLLGPSPGPYINTYSRSLFMFLGRKVAFLGLDCRTERTRDEILSEATYDAVFERCHQEIIKGETKHLIVLLGVPIAYPRLVWLENVLTSRVLDPVKALGRMGLLGNFMNKFDGGVEILDDLDDHWTAKNHKEERNWFIEELQELAAEKSVRITILGGDVHLAAVGQFYSTKSLNIPKDQDFRYMPNIISSAIVNTPPPDMMADVLNKRNRIHHLNAETDEDMIPMFTHNVDGKPRNNKHLLPRRNWCSITEYMPGSTPAPTPPSTSPTASQASLPPKSPGILQRTLSLGRNDSRPGASLIRRLSLSNKTPASADDISTPHAHAGLPSPYASAPATPRYDTAPIPTRPISTFHRRPTNLSEKAAAKGASTNHHVDLEFGLDISLNCEITQGDPSGSTEQYRLLVPALMYDGPLPEHRKRKDGILKRLGSKKRNSVPASVAGAGSRNTSRDSWQAGSNGSPDSHSVSSQEAGPPVQTGLFRRLSNRLSRSASQTRAPSDAKVLQKRRVSLDTQPQNRTLEPFKPRPVSQGNNSKIHQQAPTQQQYSQPSTHNRGSVDTTNAYTITNNTPRSPPTSFSQRPYNPPEVQATSERNTNKVNGNVLSAATPASASRPNYTSKQVAPNPNTRRQPQAYSPGIDSNSATPEIDDEEESEAESYSSSRSQDETYPTNPSNTRKPTTTADHTATTATTRSQPRQTATAPSGRGSGAAKFFGEDLPQHYGEGTSQRNSIAVNSHGGYNGIEAYGHHGRGFGNLPGDYDDETGDGKKKKGWRKFF